MPTRLILIGAALIAFGASIGSGFHFDDYAIFSDPAITLPSGWRDIGSLLQTRPLTLLTFWLNYQIGGGDPLGYHLLNLALHLTAVLLAYECLSRLISGNAALIAAALFAIHPLQSEPVNYIWARSILLATVLCLVSLLDWLKGQHWRAVVWFALALLAKEEVAAFPLFLLLVDRKRLAPLAAMFAASLATGLRVIYATTVLQGSPAGFQSGISPWDYWLAQGIAILRYLRLLVIPYGFTIDPDLRVPPAWLGLLAWVALIASIVVVRRFAGKNVALYYAAGLILLLPSSSIFPVIDLAADRRMYFPMVAFSAAAALLLVRIRPNIVGLGVLVALIGLSFNRTLVWMSDESLWSEAVRRAPEKVRPKIQLARVVPAGRGLEILNQARDLAPNDPAVPAAVGAILLKEGQPDAALPEFGRALSLDPRDARSYNNRGVALQQLGQIEAARADFLRALEIDPYLNEARQNLQRLPGR